MKLINTIGKSGYYKTKIGWIPKEWLFEKLENVATIQTGIQKGAKKNGAKSKLPYLRVANVQDGHLDLSEIKYIEVPVDKIERYSLKKGDVLMTEGGDFDKLGRGTIWRGEISPCLHQNHVFAVRPNVNRLTPEFLNYYSSGQEGKRYFISCSKQSTNLASINSTQLKQFPIPLPPLPEQRKIAEILSTWYEAIDKTQKLIEKLKKRNKGLAQLLLTGNKRLPGFEGEWKWKRADKIFENVSIKNQPKEELLAVTQENGVIPRDMLEGRVTMPSGSRNSYKLVEPGNFVISLRSFQGGLEFSEYRGIVSPAYTVLSPITEISDIYFQHYFKSYHFIGHLATSVIGIRDGKQISFKDFRTQKLPYPPFEEQKAIADILESAKLEVLACDKYLVAIQEQKKGLMQQLLTGERRVYI